MTLRQLLQRVQAFLAPQPDAAVDAREIALHILGLKNTGLVRHLGDEVPAEQEQAIMSLALRRKDGVPTQYLLGESWFMGLRFSVDENVLIPRQDTELLCETALKYIKEKNCTRALDVCTGSGALAVSLAHYAGVEMTACDLSGDALGVARRNAAENGVAVRFLQGDLFGAVPEDECWPLIVCNPPYLTRGDMENLQTEVRREPSLALYGGADGLDFYRRLRREAPGHLTEGGALMMEIGCTQGAAVCALFDGFSPRVLTDLNGLDRVVLAVKPQ